MLGYFAFAAFVATVWVANLLVAKVGIVPVGFGLEAPAAVYMVGVAFTLRDIVHRTLGPWWTVAAIVVGAGLSVVISPAFALASGVAFLVSELADLLIYTPLAERNWVGAVAASNVVGLLVDSWLFLSLSGLGLAFFWGQVVGKAWMTAIALALLLLVRLRPAAA